MCSHPGGGAEPARASRPRVGMTSVTPPPDDGSPAANGAPAKAADPAASAAVAHSAHGTSVGVDSAGVPPGQLMDTSDGPSETRAGADGEVTPKESSELATEKGGELPIDEGGKLDAAEGGEPPAEGKAGEDADPAHASRKRKGATGGSKSKKKTKSGGSGAADAGGAAGGTTVPPPLPAPHEEGFLTSCEKLILGNMGAYKRGEWERSPWMVREYETVGDFQIPPDVPEVDGANLLTKLACSMPHNWVGPDVKHMLQVHHDTPIQIDFSLDEPLHVGVDLQLCNLWGIDSHSRMAISDVLKHLPEYSEAAQRDAFIERHLLPAANASGDRGWDILTALARVEEGARRAEDAAQMAAVQALTKVVREIDERPPEPVVKKSKPLPEQAAPPSEPAADEPADPVDPSTLRRSFRLHPKGQGVICVREGGFPEGTFVSAYYGDIYPSWRWYERQDALKKSNPNSDLPDFYNIMMERPAEDPRGYDVLFVEGAMKGTFASRLSHSCFPNCMNIPIIRNGRLEIHMYTCRRVELGEELCWDYACVTESEKEWAAAICLCGSARCRGSFLYYAGTAAFAEFINTKHGFLERNAMLARAVTEPLTEEDRARLAAVGIKDSALTNVAGDKIPDWLTKWAALAAECVDVEEKFITGFLEAHPKYKYTAESAAVEARGVKHNRIFNIVTTLDKIKYCMRNQSGEAATQPPLVALSEAEVVAHLWSGPNAIARRCLATARRFVCPGASSAKATKKRAAANNPHPNADTLTSMDELASTPLGTAAAARAALRQISAMLRATGPGARGDGGPGALVCEHREVRRSTPPIIAFLPLPHKFSLFLWQLCIAPIWFRAVSLETFKSAPVSFEGDDRVPPNLQRAEQGSDAEKFLSRRYGGQYCWGQLVSWYKQTIYNPEASLSAERRGTMSLPDPESAYGNPKSYWSKERKQMLDMIEKTPNRYFPTSFIWSFKNPAKIYGSPQLDAAIASAMGKEGRLAEIIADLRSAT
eukprot:jgi/Tetstr1/438986/TSEL_027478.t1